jgi:hypothetical protein
MSKKETYVYTIFDANPNDSSGTAWPSHDEIVIEAESDDDVIEEVLDVMGVEAAGLNPDDGYDVGQRLYAIIWDDNDVIVAQLSYKLTAEDLGIDEDDDGDEEE